VVIFFLAKPDIKRKYPVMVSHHELQGCEQACGKIPTRGATCCSPCARKLAESFNQTHRDRLQILQGIDQAQWHVWLAG
jgi:hypothetical protein